MTAFPPDGFEVTAGCWGDIAAGYESDQTSYEAALVASGYGCAIDSSVAGFTAGNVIRFYCINVSYGAPQFGTAPLSCVPYQLYRIDFIYKNGGANTAAIVKCTFYSNDAATTEISGSATVRQLSSSSWARQVVYVTAPASAVTLRAVVEVAGNGAYPEVSETIAFLLDSIIVNPAYFPPRFISYVYMNSTDASTYFDGTGLGYFDKAYSGWAICNGSNGTPNLADKFVRCKASGTIAAGATGGNDSSSHTHDRGVHQHLTAVGFDAYGIYGNADGGGAGYLPTYGSTVVTKNRIWTATTTAATTDLRQAYTNTDGSGNTGAASATDNKPAYYELIPVMRID
jgi:hypothetical protein